MRKRCLWLPAAALLLATVPARAATYYVRQAGRDQADGATPATAFRTILRAVQAANHGDSIVIGPGSYRADALLAERFAADGSPMRIVGDETGKQTTDAPGPVVVQPLSPTRPALRLYRLRRVVVSGLTFRGPGQGLALEKCLDAMVERCTFDGLSRGLAATATQGLRVESCVFRGCAVGLCARGATATRIAHATIVGSSSAGVLLLGCGPGAIRNSILAANNSSLVADDVSAPSWTSDRNVLRGTVGVWGSVPVIANAYEWSAASGNDRHSIHVVPAFADPLRGDLRIAPAVSWAGGLPGMAVGVPLKPPVTTGRDGKPFRPHGGAVCAGAYDFPDPQPAAPWRKLSARLAGTRPRQSAGIYRDDGTLIRTLLADAAGVRDLFWDGRDDLGQPVTPGRYQLRSIEHDVRLVDDGAVGDNGCPLGAYHCDNADRVVALPDGGFIITTIYDEAGYPLRGYASSGQPVFAVNLAEKDFTGGIALAGDHLYGAIGKGEKTKLVRLSLRGERVPMATGAESYPLFGPGEKAKGVAGLAVVGKAACVGIPDLNVVRVVDLATGRKTADWPLPGAGDLARDGKGTLWAIAGTDVVSLDANGRIAKRYPTGLLTPQYLAAGSGRLAVVDRKAAKVAWLDAANGKILRTLGRQRPKGQWTPVRADLFSDPRGAAILPDGRLLLTEHARVRALWPDSLAVSFELLSNFMDTMVVHPTRPEFLYCHPGVFRADPKTGAWEWLVESPTGQEKVPGVDKPRSLSLGSPHGAVVLGGRPFIFYFNRNGRGNLRLLDVSDPLKPRMALDYDNSHKVFGGWAYATVAFTRGGDIVAGANYSLQFKRVAFNGLDAQHNPVFDFENAATLGPKDDPSPRKMKCIEAITSDRATGDIYYLAVTDQHNKMVPAWGADGTGVGRSTPNGAPLWFALSSGGNYQSISAFGDGTNAWVMGGKSFGGQIDLFNADGLRLTTGNWAWPCHFQIGFVDLRYGVHAYRRPDGKVGAYVEDDAIGRFGRVRVDGAETLTRRTDPIDWAGPAAPAGPPPVVDQTAAKPIARVLTIPKVASLKPAADWAPWEQAGVVPQIVILPSVTFRRSAPDDLWQTFRAGTAIGAVAHDGAHFLVYFLVADDTMHFDDPQGRAMWMFDSVELWMEEEQFGLGLTRAGAPALFKYRHHNRAGKAWSANYPLPRENVWAATLDDLAAHPLGQRLAAVTGASLRGRTGYAVMGKIPFPEVKLVGGIAGRKGKDILPTTGKAGEIVRIGVAIGAISAWGREQDYKVAWPSAMMFSDPTRSQPFVLGQ